MSNQKRQMTVAGQGPCEGGRDLQSLLGPAPLLAGEDAAAYDELRRRVHTAVAPADVIEEIWVRDVVDLLWETMRLRRLEAKLMQSAAHEGLDRLLRPLTGRLSNSDLINDWARRDLEAILEVNALLKRGGFDQEAIAAQTLVVKLDEVERIDRMIMQTEARRNTILREVDRHRETLARRLRDASATIEDGEFTEVAPPQQKAAERGPARASAPIAATPRRGRRPARGASPKMRCATASPFPSPGTPAAPRSTAWRASSPGRARRQRFSSAPGASPRRK